MLRSNESFQGDRKRVVSDRRRRAMAVELLEDRRLLTATIPTQFDIHSHGPAGPDVPQGVFTAEQIEALENVPFDTNLSSKTPVPGNNNFPLFSNLLIDDGFCRPKDADHPFGPSDFGTLSGDNSSSVVTIVLDFKEPAQGNTSDIFGNVTSSFDVTNFGFTATDFDAVADAILAEVEADFFAELVGTVAGPPGQELAINFVIGDIGTPPLGTSEYYFVQIGTGTSGPHSGGTLGVAGGSVVRSSSGAGPNFGIQVGDVVASVFTDAIATLSGLTPANALTSGELEFTANAISGTTSHEIAHAVSLSHIDKALSVQPTADRSPIMGTGAIDLPNNDRIGNREFSLSGFDSQSGGAQRFHIQQLVDALGLRNTETVTITPPTTGLLVSEDGVTDDYEIQLTIAPTADVEITATADNQTLLSLDGTTFTSSVVLTFSNTDPQTVTVMAVDDTINEGVHSSVLTHEVTASTDSNYPLNAVLTELTATIIDNESTPIGPLVSIQPLGSQIYSWQGAGDFLISPQSNYYTITLDGFQTISAAVSTSDEIETTLEVVSPDGFVLASSSAASAGDNVVLQNVSVAGPGEYTVRVSSDDGFGSYILDVGLNTAFEVETYDTSATNDDASSAQAIAASSLAGIRTSQRSAVLGRGGRLFFEDFALETFDTENWSSTTNATIDDVGIAEPSPTFSARLNGDPSDGDLLESTPLNLSNLTNVELSYYFQRTGGGESTDIGDDLIVDYLNNADTWIELDRQLGSGPDMTTYQLSTLVLPSDALHADFQFRFSNTGTTGPFDDWFVDDISLNSIGEDWYSFLVNDGQLISLVYETLNSTTGGVLELYDATATLLATGIAADNLAQGIQSYIDQTNNAVPDTYYARIVRPTADYSFLLTLDAAFDTELNSTIATAQPLSHATQVWGHTEQGGTGGLQILSSFPGISATGFIPPDPIHAVGPDHVVASVNTDIAIFDKVTGNQLFRQNMSGAAGFFGSAGATSVVFDPWVIWDDDSQRFFVMGIDIASNTESNVFIAVSQDATPTGGNDWFKYKIDFTHDPTGTGLGTGAHFPDYEKMGVNDDAIFVSGNYFPISGGSGVYAGITAIEKAPMLTGGPANILYEEHFSGFSVFPLNQFDSGSTQYFAEEFNSTTIRIHAIADTLTNPTRSTFNLSVPTFNQPIDVPQLGGGTPADSVSSRIMTGVWRDGSAWFAHAIRDPAIGDGENVVRWYEVDTNDFPNNSPSLVQTGNVDPGPGVHAWMPAIAVNGVGDMALGFSTGGPNQFFSASVTGRLNSDPPGFTTSPVIEYATGLGNYVALDGIGRNRWGDYSGMAVDPADDTTFWAFNEYASTGNQWDTQIVSFDMDASAESDFFSFEVIAGDFLTITTSTPLDGPNQPLNLLDPALELYDPAGNIVASDENGASDGRNAVINFSSNDSGTYTIRVLSSAASTGHYLLGVNGATGTNNAPRVIDTNPDNSQTLPAFPTQFSVQFSEAVDISSIQPSDLTINGIPAANFTVVSGNKIDFTLDPASNSGDGNYNALIQAGSISDLQGQVLPSDFSAQFQVDTTGPVILSTTWNGETLPANKTLSSGPLTFTANLSEELFIVASARSGPFTPGADDVLLVDTITGNLIPPSFVSFDNITKVFRANFDQTLAEGSYRLTLLSGDTSFEDEIGNDLDGEPIGPESDGTVTGDGIPGGDYFVEFTVDAAAHTFTDATRLLPLGMAVSTSNDNFAAISDPTDQDDFTFFAEAGQTISVLADSLSPNGILSLEILGLTSVYSGTAPGDLTILPSTLIPASGEYTLRVTADAAVRYSLQLLNNLIDERAFGDTSLTNRMPIDASRSNVGVTTFSVLGTVFADAPTGFTLANDPNTFVDISTTGTPLNLSDDGTATIQTTIGNNFLPAGSVTVSNNGVIVAGANQSVGFTNAPLPTNNLGNALLPFWDDINTGSGNVFWQERSINGNDALIVQWENRPHFTTGFTGTFQLQLFQSGPVAVRYAYEDVDFGSAAFNGGASATIGWQNTNGSAIQHSFNTASVTDGDHLDLIQDAADTEGYTIDLSEFVGQSIDITLASNDGADLSGQTLQLLDANNNIFATGSPAPLGSNATNFGLGILDFSVPDIGDNVYRINFISTVTTQYALSLNIASAFNLEPNDFTVGTPLREIGFDQPGVGFISGFTGTVEPDAYAIDQVLDNVVPRVTLSNAVTGGSIFVANAPFMAPTGTRVFAPGIGQADGFREDVNGLRADFDSPVDFVSIDAGSDDSGDVVRLRAFDVNDNLLAEVTSGLIAEGNSETLVINRPSEDIAYIIAGGLGGDVAPLDNLQFAVVGDPDDYYQITLSAGDSIVLQTETPMSSPSMIPFNSLDPELQIFASNGTTALATDLNSLDGRNAQLAFTAPATDTYFVRVGTTSGLGEYVVRVLPQRPTVESVIVNDGSNHFHFRYNPDAN